MQALQGLITLVYVSCLVGLASTASISSALWMKFEQMKTENSKMDDVAKHFLHRFHCFEECQSLEKCLQDPYDKLVVEMELTESNFLNASAILLDHVLTSGSECDKTKTVCSRTSECGIRYLIDGEPTMAPAVQLRKALDTLLGQLKSTYEPQAHEKCFSAADVVEEVQIPKLQNISVRDTMTALFLRLYKGECIITNGSVDFIEDIFMSYAENNGSITEEELEKLMKDMGIVRQDDEHDHYGHDHHGHDHEDDKLGKSRDSKEHNHGHDHGDNQAGKPEDSKDHDHGHDHDHEHNHRRKRHADHDDHHHEESSTAFNSTIECWTASRLFHYFDEDESHDITRSEFYHLAPALIHQKLRPNCIEKPAKPERTALEVYGYGTLAVFIISFCSVLGVVLMPIQNSSIYQYVMMCFIALAFGTLTGDALLHLIPESVGLHNHADEGAGHDHSEDEGVHPYFWKFFVVLMSIYGLFVFEGLVAIALHGDHSHEDEKKGHGHSHIPSIDLVQMTRKEKDVKTISNETLDSTVSGPIGSNSSVSDIEQSKADLQSPNQQKMCFGMTTLALVVIIGDAIHNVADGLTIGAAFSSSTKGGISSALAILFHELPHEFGDFVILLSAGFTFKKALIWNFAASLTAFIGLYVGIEVGENEAARQWILTVAAGMFLYIAVGDMLPELKNQKGNNAIITFVVQNIGVLFGMTFMVLMSVFESKIKV